MKLTEKGRENGQNGMPKKTAKTADSVEMQIIDKIQSLRKVGLDYYQEMCSAYATRLQRASQLTHEIISASQTARGDFLKEATNHRAYMAGALNKVTDALGYMSIYRNTNCLERPYLSEKGGWPSLFFIAVLALVIEAILNGYMFAEADPNGLVGGIFVAVIISFANVVISSFFGITSRYVNHTSLTMKIVGGGAIAALIVFAFYYNFLIGHYRDALQAVSKSGLESDAISAAGLDALERIKSSVVGIKDTKSFILVVMGVAISVISAVKAYTTFDPYPGYHSVHQSVESALEDYAVSLQDAIDTLQEDRNVAIEEFQDARKLSDQLISEAADALQGRSSLSLQLGHFLTSANTKQALLIQIYRDANIAARPDKSGTPPSFNLEHSVKDVDVPEFNEAETVDANDERRRIRDASESAINSLASMFDAYVRYFPSVDQLRAGWSMGDLPDWNKVLQSFENASHDLDFGGGEAGDVNEAIT